MKFNGMKCVLLAALVAPLSFGAFADQGQSPKPAPQKAGEVANKRTPTAAKLSDVAGTNVVALKLKDCQFLLNGTYKP